jgi:hypothetical protein
MLTQLHHAIRGCIQIAPLVHVDETPAAKLPLEKARKISAMLIVCKTQFSVNR